MVSSPVSHTLVRALRALPAFAELDEGTLCSVVGASSNLVWRSGSTIFEPGEAADALYIILSGSVRIAADSGEEVARLGPREFFGEQSLLMNASHSKQAEALEDSELMVLPKQSFEALLTEDPGLAEVVRRSLEQRLDAVGPGRS